MNRHTDHQIIRDNGVPMFVVVPYQEYLRLVEFQDIETTIPHEVVEKSLVEELGLVRAWREYKGLSQGVVAKKMGISQAAYSQMERPGARLRKKTLEKIAAALEIEVGQLKI
ncbi:MAG: helix-turn-helix transcriptional regulator [Desulfatirhabdiaceae bacterium]